MKVLVIGGGGREHALAWRLAQGLTVEQVFAAPGNPGIAKVASCVPVTDPLPDGFLKIARDVGADLTVVGPEAPLVAGVVDAFRNAGLAIFGPTASMARLEGSKNYAKDFFAQHRIPTARFVNVTDLESARAALGQFSLPVVIKADGLAAGKGVIIAQSRGEAEDAIQVLGRRLVIEEFLKGEEVSLIVLCDGQNAVALEPAQDHKRIFDGDEGPNTGGMGAYSDSLILSAAETEDVMERIIRPTVSATGFTGFLYAGLIMTTEGPKLLEYNVRMGDPETQALMHRLRTGLGDVLLAAAHGAMSNVRLDWDPRPSVCVVLASGGYPAEFAKGYKISGIGDAEATGSEIFQAGTRVENGGVVTVGGRVLGVTANGETLSDAIGNAYRAAEKIHFTGMHYRRDIGQKGLKRW